MLPNYKTSVKKVDNEEKMSGMAVFTGDIHMDEAYFAIPVRSTISYGKILKNLLNVHLLIQVGENDTYFDKKNVS